MSAPRTGRVAGAVALLTLCCVGSEAHAYDLVVIQSFENPVYAKTIQGYQDTCGGSVTTFTLGKDKTLADGDLDQIKTRKPAAILAIGSSALEQILSRKPPMPVVFTAITEKPSNLNPAAGILMNVPMDRQLDVLLKIAPAVKTIGVVYNPAKTQYFVDDLLRAAKARGVTVVTRNATNAPDAVKEVGILMPTVQALVIAPDTSVHSEQLEKAAGAASLKLKVPVIGFKSSQLANGFLFASEMDPLEMGRQAGDVTKALVQGRAPQPAYVPLRKYNIVLNQRIADQFGFKIPVALITETGAKIYDE